MIGKPDNAQAPDLVEPVIGFRSWHLEKGRLKGIVYTEEWKDITQAKCRRHKGHRSPDPDCSCGLYAFHKPDSWLRVYSGINPVGAVQMWGRCEVHQDGLRAEYAKPVVITKPSAMLQRLSFSFGVLNFLGATGLLIFLSETKPGLFILSLTFLGTLWLIISGALGIGLWFFLRGSRKALKLQIDKLVKNQGLEVVKYRNLKEAFLKYGKPYIEPGKSKKRN